MKKMKKLLSVLLAVVLALSCMSVMASAAKATYQSVDNLEGLDAYSPYGTVTRLSTEERTSMLLDFLDVMLPPLNINMGTVVDTMGLTITINFTSVDALLDSLDSFKSTMSGTLWGIAAAIVNLGILEELEFGSWQADMTRDGTKQETIIYEILELLASNTSVINTVLTDGIELGLVASFLGGSLDLSSINKIVVNLPKMIKGMLLPLFERWDDTADEAVAMEGYQDGSDTTTALSTILGTLIGNYFTKPMSMTTVKADSTGNIISDHTLPGDLANTTHRRIYVQNGTEIVVYQYYFQTDVDANEQDDITTVGYNVVGTYTAKVEYEGVENSDYVFVMTKDAKGEAVENGETLKYYETGSYWLPSFANAGGTININTESAAALLYKMIPYVFDAMAPTVVNGSLKKLLAGFFGTTWENLGDITDAEVLAKVQTLPGYDANLEVFGKQGEYLWEWSAFDMITVDGVDYFYYRYQDDFFVGNAEKANEYMDIINWDFKITGDFLNEFIPAGTTGAEKSTAGYTRILHGVNDFIVKIASTVLDADFYATLGLTKGDNSKLVGNIKALAQKIIDYHPEHIFGETFDAEGNSTGYGDFYNLLMSSDNDTVLTGIAALAIDALADQMIIEPSAIYDATTGKATVKVGGILAAMLRELATQLLPSVDYDALIYVDYNKGTFVSGKDNSYWLDVILTMGVDIGMKYIHNLADMGEDKTAWSNLGWSDSRTYTEAMLTTTDSSGNSMPTWEKYVDYIVDWALTVGETSWNMSNLVDVSAFTVDMETVQDPWLKIDTILDNLLFLDQFTSETSLEEGLRGTILNLVNLKWENILGTESVVGLLDIPDGTDGVAASKLRTNSILSALSLEIRDLLNGLFKKVGGGSFYLIPETITTIDQLATQANIKTIAVNLVGALTTAFNNGLLVTALPIVNFFLGWTTDAQKYADPSIYFASEYVYDDGTDGTATTTINVINNSAGMLLKHRSDINNSGYKATEDAPYTLKVTNITSSIDGTTFDKESLDVAPYGSGTITATVPFDGTDKVARFVVTYSFMGKDGKAVGGEMKMVTYQLFTAVAPETNNVEEQSGTGWTVSAYNAYVFTNDIYTAVTTQAVNISYSKPTLSPPGRMRIGSAINDSSPAGIAADYFEQVYTTSTTSNPGPLEAAGWNIYFGGEDGVTDKNTATGRLYNAKSGVTAQTEFPLGLYDMGQIAVKVLPQSKNCDGEYTDSNGSSAVWIYDYYYYKDYDVDALVKGYTDMMLLAEDFSAGAQDAFATYEAALINAVRLAQHPITLSYNDNIGPQIEGAIETLDAAYEALMEAEDDANASAEAADTAVLEAALALDTSVNGKEINYQDFDLFEYFEYQDYRTAARNLLKGMIAPAIMDDYYIEGSGITCAELEKVIAAEANANIKAGIEASKVPNDPAAIAASKEANENFVAPTYAKLYIDDQAARINYYRQFILPLDADLTFLNREISYANANYPMSDEALYTAGSWATYKAAYDKAGTITDNDLPSDVFNAKFELMRAMKDLLLKSEAANESGAVDGLKALRVKAEAILATTDGSLALTEEALAEGITLNDALAALIKALGYYYTGEDGNTWNLYADSALEYIDNDRPNKSTNLDKIEIAEANLDAAINLFVTEVEAPELGGIVDAENGTEGVVDIENGYVYGVTAGADDLTLFFEVENGTFEMQANEAGYTNGTGATLVVKDTKGEVAAEYTLVVFGDVNGDAEVTSTDLTSVKNASLGGTIAGGEAYSFAADVNGDTEVTSTDLTSVKNASLGGAITVNPYVG